MKFEVLYANGVQNEVELQGHTVVIGRDPGCDLVLADTKCSRRHAIVEMGPSGLSLRDNGSANGVFVNGRKVERSPLVPGDVIRMGETVITILAESNGTVVMGEDEMDEYKETENLTRPHDLADLPGLPGEAEPPAPPPPVVSPPPPPRSVAPPAPPPVPEASVPPHLIPTAPISALPPPPRPMAPPPPPPRAAPPQPSAPTPAPPRFQEASARVSRPPMPAPVARVGLERPMTVTALAVLWLLAGAFYGAVGLGVAIFGPPGSSRAATGVAGVFLALLSWVVGLGLWARAPWARLLQLVLAGIGVLTCVFTLPSIAILAYMLRPEIALHFSGPRILTGDELEKAKAPTPELAFALAIAGTLALSLVLGGLAAYVGRTLWTRSRGPVPEATAPPPATEPAR